MKIKAFIMDVDGTLTDGKIYMGSEGEVFKAFDIKDGYGIHEILPAYGVKTIIITGRESKIVENRAKELEIDYVYQSVKNKVELIEEICKILSCTENELAYIGDDIIDLAPMMRCGSRGCPRNAAREIVGICDFVSEKKGGEGTGIKE